MNGSTSPSVLPDGTPPRSTTETFEVRIHGRGGQGVVTAADILALAAFIDGRQAQAFPSFGSERMGAPVTSYCRISDQVIKRHDPVTEVDALVVQDATLLHEAGLFSGLKEAGFVIINSQGSPTELGLVELQSSLISGHLTIIPASAIARRVTGNPLPNSVLLGSLAALTGCVTAAALCAAIHQRLPQPVARLNEAAATEGAAAAFPPEAGGDHA